MNKMVGIRAGLLKGSIGLVLFLVGVPALFAYDGKCATADDVANLPPGMWCEVPDSRLISAEKKPGDWADWDGSRSASYDSYQRIDGIRGLTAWSGGAFDSKRNRLLVFGGGHNNYGGNEIYAFSLETLRWERVSEPTAFPNRIPETQNADGTPISRHTYGGLAYIDSLDALFALGGAPDAQEGGCGTPGTWFFSLAERDRSPSYEPSFWDRWDTGGTVDTSCDDDALYDSAANRVLYHSRYGWFALDLASGEWQRVNGTMWEQTEASATIGRKDDGSRVIVQLTSGKVDGYRELDLETSNLQSKTVRTTGDRSAEQANDPGIVFDEAIGRVVAWAGGESLYVLDINTRNWQRLDPKPGNLANPGGRDANGGTFGRFQKSEKLGVYIAMDLVSENVYLYRLDSEQLNVQEAAVPAPPADFFAD